MTIDRALIAGIITRVFVSIVGAWLAKLGVDTAQIHSLAGGVGEVGAAIVVYEAWAIWSKAKQNKAVAKVVDAAKPQDGGQ